jgi:hypothetical protein
MAQRSAGPPPVDQLPEDEQFVLCHWAVQAVAEAMLIDYDAAFDLLSGAQEAGRLSICGTSMFAGVMVDGKWVVVEGRERITAATHEWQTLRALEREFEPSPE